MPEETAKQEWHAPQITRIDVRATELNCGSKVEEELEDLYLEN